MLAQETGKKDVAGLRKGQMLAKYCFSDIFLCVCIQHMIYNACVTFGQNKDSCFLMSSLCAKLS